jgi:hypothetical protein
LPHGQTNKTVSYGQTVGRGAEEVALPVARQVDKWDTRDLAVLEDGFLVPRRRVTAEQIITKLREADGPSTRCRKLGYLWSSGERSTMGFAHTIL